MSTQRYEVNNPTYIYPNANDSPYGSYQISKTLYENQKQHIDTPLDVIESEKKYIYMRNTYNPESEKKMRASPVKKDEPNNVIYLLIICLNHILGCH